MRKLAKMPAGFNVDFDGLISFCRLNPSNSISPPMVKNARKLLLMHADGDQENEVKNLWVS